MDTEVQTDDFKPVNKTVSTQRDYQDWSEVDDLKQQLLQS